MIRPVALVLTLAHAFACVPDGDRPDRTARTEATLLQAEDARAPEGASLDRLLGATGLEDARARLTAIRALGRLEDPALLPEIVPSLDDPDPLVRATAVEAMAQAVHGSDGSEVLAQLLQVAQVETDPGVRGSLARSLGRLGLDAAERRRVGDALVTLAGSPGATPPETLIGVALGFEALTRVGVEEGLSGPAADRLIDLAAFGRGSTDAQAGRTRALAITALGRARRITLELIEAGAQDAEPEVRRTVLGYLDAVIPSRRPALLDAALSDPSSRVVLEALRIVAAGPRNSSACERLLAAAAPDRDPGVRVVALTALGRACPERTPQVTALRSAASELAAEEGATWQPAARALVSLASVDARSAQGLLGRFVDHASPFVRVYAARTAGILRDRATLLGLARDTHANVRNAALEALFELDGHGIDELAMEQLQTDDPQLLITVAHLLEGSPRPEAAPALLGAFERISEARRETWRDPRLALLTRIAELGRSDLAPRLLPFLRDYDPLVAGEVAEILTAWTGRAHMPEPTAPPRATLPTAGELEALARASVTLHMRSGGSIAIELLTELAPLNAWRFVRLARAGYFDGLTFHRWEPNFVIQGGSPGANEYAGDGPYTRDEVGASHWRGTVGVSTRGRDTGDGQIFINLVDNVRLDHDYTVFGVVTEGMDVVDRVLEGAIIERAEVRSGP